MSKRQSVLILGSTGSIGEQSLEVIEAHPDQFCVIGLAAYSNVSKVYQQCLRYNPEFALLVEEQAAQSLSEQCRQAGLATQVLGGEDALSQLARYEQVDTVISGIVGSAGLPPTWAAAEAGKRILLANKESLVMAGGLLMTAAAKNNAEIIPLDSEHNAIYQCLPRGYQTGRRPASVSKLTLTASGGPFRQYTASQLQTVTPEQACRHPNWAMGAKNSIDSATMINKGLEVIEAHWLFGLPWTCIDVLIHPQSVVHALVSYTDGSVLAQLAPPDMRIPIAYGLSAPERLDCSLPQLDLASWGKLEFESPNSQFPCLQLAYEAIKIGGTAPVCLNGANEAAVSAFLNQQIRFVDIPRVISEALENMAHRNISELKEVFVADQQARRYTAQAMKKLEAKCSKS